MTERTKRSAFAEHYPGWVFEDGKVHIVDERAAEEFTRINEEAARRWRDDFSRRIRAALAVNRGARTAG